MAEEKKKIETTEVNLETKVEETSNATNNSNSTINDVWNKFTNTIAGMYKKPLSTIKEETKNPNMRDTWVMLVAIAISFALIMMTGFKSIMALSYSGISIDDFVEVPYLKLFVYGTIIYLVMSFVPIIVSFVVSRVMKDDKFDFKKSMCLYATSMSVVIPVNLLMALLYLINFLPWVGTILAAVVSVFSFFNYILGYLSLNKFEDDKKSWAITSLVIVWVVVAFFGLALILGSASMSLGDDMTNPTHHTNYSDLIDW